MSKSKAVVRNNAPSYDRNSAPFLCCGNFSKRNTFLDILGSNGMSVLSGKLPHILSEAVLVAVRYKPKKESGFHIKEIGSLNLSVNYSIRGPEGALWSINQ